MKSAYFFENTGKFDERRKISVKVLTEFGNGKWDR
jgi:hypothetical protein